MNTDVEENDADVLKEAVIKSPTWQKNSCITLFLICHFYFCFFMCFEKIYQVENWKHMSPAQDKGYSSPVFFYIRSSMSALWHAGS